MRKYLPFFVFFTFLLICGIAYAITHTAYGTLKFTNQVTSCESIKSFELCISYGCYIWDNACHSMPQTVTYCNEIAKFDKYSLCLTKDNRLTIVIKE